MPTLSKTQTNSIDVLRALQHGDSFFPAGAIAMSAGLETLVNDDVVSTAMEVEAFLLSQLRGRWSTFERPVLVAAYRAATNLDSVTQIDKLVEAQTLAEELRVGSIRAGGALLSVHVKLATVNSAEYQALIRQSLALGHNSVVQGLVWQGARITESTAEAMSAHTFCVGLIGAALRLAVIGHTDAQAILMRAHRVILELITIPCKELDEISTFSPQQEIAVMRHETMSYRLFIN